MGGLKKVWHNKEEGSEGKNRDMSTNKMLHAARLLPASPTHLYPCCTFMSFLHCSTTKKKEEEEGEGGRKEREVKKG